MDTPAPSLSERLAQRLLQPVDGRARERAAGLLVDWLGCALAGLRYPLANQLRQVVRTQGPGPAVALAAGRRTVADALLVNAALGNVLEMDDVHRQAILHPGPVVIPVALAAAQAAGADEFIERLPQGYDTILEENASNLSGGQKQRLSIARSLLLKPRVLILDEAASALDPESEAIFIRNLGKMAVGRTVIMISHRLSTLVNADAILVMQQGKLADSGRHEELLSKSATYQQLWHQQTSHI